MTIVRHKCVVVPVIDANPGIVCQIVVCFDSIKLIDNCIENSSNCMISNRVPTIRIVAGPIKVLTRWIHLRKHQFDNEIQLC